MLLVLLGEEAAATVYRHLNQPQLQRLTQEIRELSGVKPEIAAQILEEYYRLSLTQDYLTQGGEKYARSLLMKAFGSEGAKDLLEQVNRAQVLTANQMDALQKANPKELARFLEGEQPQTIALILAYLDAKAASALLMRLPEVAAGGVGQAAGVVAQLFSRDGAEGFRGAAQAAADAWASRAGGSIPASRARPT